MYCKVSYLSPHSCHSEKKKLEKTLVTLVVTLIRRFMLDVKRDKRTEFVEKVTTMATSLGYKVLV